MRKLLDSLLLMLCFVAGAQTQVFTVKDGLSNNNVTCVLQARNGYVWVGTANGLNLFDGYSFYEFNRNNGLSNGKIKCLHEDRNGLLWIGTWEGLNILDQKTGKIKKLFQKEGAKGDVYDSEISCIEEASDGSMLISIGKGVIMKAGNGRDFKKVYSLPKPDNVIKYQIYAMKVLADSSVAIVTNYNVVKKLTRNFEPDTAFRADQRLNLDIMDMSLSSDKKDLMLYYIWGDLLQASGKTGTVIKTTHLKQRMPHDYIRVTQLIGGKKLWAGFSQGGVLSADLATGAIADHTADLRGYLTGLPSAICEGSNGIVWIGSNYGLIKFCPRKHLFENYLYLQNVPYADRNSIRGMMEDAKGDIYVGSYNGLFRIEHKTCAIQHFKFRRHGEDSVAAYLPYRLLDDSNYIWITSETRGFLRFNKKTKDMELPLRLSFFKGFALLAGGPDTLWVGTHHGLFVYNKRHNTMTKYSNPKDRFDVSSVEISELIRDAQGNMWIGSYASGIFKKNRYGGIVEHYSNDDTPYSINFVTALFFSNDSILWVGTRGGGLGKINIRDHSIGFYTKRDGLSDNSVAGIVKDASGILWISTFNGLSRFNPLNGDFENYYDKDGLTDNEFNTVACLKSSDGKIYMGGLNGINAFFPQHLRRKRKQQPRIFLTRFEKYDGSADKLIERRLDLTDLAEIRFANKDKFLSFSFALDDYYNPLHNTFYYQLEGLDNTWNNIGSQSSLRFNNLQAGSYRLRIRGVNSDGNVSVNELDFRLLVSQPFYNTWWFYALVLLITVALVFLITRYRIYQSLKITRLRTKISSDLHDEVGSLLTRISIQAELMKRNMSQSDTIDEVSRIADTSRQATAAMSDVLWSIDARNDKMGSLLDRLREQAGETLFPLDIKVDFTVRHLDLNREIDTLIRQNLFLIFKEAINNIAKHSGAEKVEVLLENRTNYFVMIIADNGQSAKKGTGSRRGQGLNNMHMRADALGGTIDIDATNGYTITLRLKKFA